MIGSPSEHQREENPKRALHSPPSLMIENLRRRCFREWECVRGGLSVSKLRCRRRRIAGEVEKHMRSTSGAMSKGENKEPEKGIQLVPQVNSLPRGIFPTSRRFYLSACGICAGLRRLGTDSVYYNGRSEIASCIHTKVGVRKWAVQSPESSRSKN